MNCNSILKFNSVQLFTKIFLLYVQKEASTRDTVVIKPARLQDSGVYKCIVTTESPDFLMDRNSINITVGGELKYT